MTLPASGKIHLSQIGVEAGKSLFSPVDMNNIELRKLVNKLEANSSISANDFYSKAYGVGPGYALQDFTPVTLATRNTEYLSNVVYALSDTSFGINCDAPAYYRINGGVWESKDVLGYLAAGDYVQLKTVSSASASTLLDVVARFGPTVTKVFSITTGALLVHYVAFNSNSSVSYNVDVYGSRGIVTNASHSCSIGGAIQEGAVVHSASLNGVANYVAAGTRISTGSSFDNFQFKGQIAIPYMGGETPIVLDATGVSSDSVHSQGTYKNIAINTIIDGILYTKIEISAFALYTYGTSRVASVYSNYRFIQ